MSQAWMIASGKGGVGKSILTSALAISLAGRNLPTAAIDTNIGLRNLDLALGLESRVVYDVVDVAREDCNLEYALIKDAKHPGLSLLPAAQIGVSSSMTAEDWTRVVHKLRKHFAYILMDAPGGLDRGLQSVIPAADQTLLVTTPDDISIRDAERVLAQLEAQGKPRPMLIVNRVNPEWVRKGDMYGPQTVANVLDVPLLGFIPEDPEILRALGRHESFMDTPCPATEAMQRITSRFLGEYVPMPAFERHRFWGRK